MGTDAAEALAPPTDAGSENTFQQVYTRSGTEGWELEGGFLGILTPITPPAPPPSFHSLICTVVPGGAARGHHTDLC